MEVDEDDDEELPELPNDIIGHEILARLPPKSLPSLRSVCKSWSSLIPARNSSSLLLDITNTNTNTNQHHFISLQLNQLQTPKPPTTANCLLTLSPHQLPPLHHHIQSSNGFICLIHLCCMYDFGNDSNNISDSEIVALHDHSPILVFNPFKRQLTTLPLASLASLPINDDGLPENKLKRRRAHVVYNFGFSPPTNEYKVLQVQVFSEGSPNKAIFKIFTVGSSSWSDIHVNHLSSNPLWCQWFSRNGETGVCIDGAIYWLHMWKDDIIVVFHVGEERFGEISLPRYHYSNPKNNDDVIYYTSRCNNKQKQHLAIVKQFDERLNLNKLLIVEVGGCVAIIHVYRSPGMAELWICKQQERRWVKEIIDTWSSSSYFSSSSASGGLVSLHTVHTGELLVGSDGGLTQSPGRLELAQVWLRLYNFKSKKIRRHRIVLPKWIDPQHMELKLLTA